MEYKVSEKIQKKFDTLETIQNILSSPYLVTTHDKNIIIILLY